MLRLERPTMFPTWTYKQAGHSVIERGNRIRPERHNRKNIQKITWKSSDWVKGYGEDGESRVSSMTIADVSPSVAIRRVLLLYENQQYREAANFINRLNYSTFKAILRELPVELFVDNIPQTLAILEALYARVFLADGVDVSIKLLRPDSVVMHMVRVFAMQHEDSPMNSLILDPKHPIVASCKKLLKVIVLSEPRMKKIISTRKRALDKSIKGLGQHGMVGTSENTLMNLHEALKLEFERVIHRYKSAVQKLDELSLAPKQPVTRSISHGPAPIKASHQRQLSLRQDEIQERLIKNKTLLNVIEPTLNNQTMNTLLGILQKRIETDKDALFQYTQLRKEVKDMSSNAVVASVLMRFSQGCQQLLELMKDFGDDDNDDSSTDISGYHSDSDSAIALSGSSPVGSTTNRAYKYNLLYRSVRFGNRNRSQRSSGSSDQSLMGDTSSFLGSTKSSMKQHSNNVSEGSQRCYQIKIPSVETRGICKLSESPTPSIQLSTSSHSSLSHDTWKIASLRREVEVLKTELTQSRHNIECLQERERKMKERLAEQARMMLDRGIRFENVVIGERRPTALIRRYGNLYAQSRVDTLDALDSIPELEHAHDLKSKILFSAVVLSFRSVYNTICEIRSRIRHILQIMEERDRSDPVIRDLDLCITNYMKNNADRFDLRNNLEEVLSQIWATLYDYPSLKNCEGLKIYVKDCVRLAWNLSNQYPPFVIEYETRTFRRDLHVRFHSSNQESNHIKTYLWPTLLEGRKGPCVHKGVVIT